MGGGDLNMKKSWHPVLLTNQARVWEVEKKAHEEKKKLDQLRKELEEERQLAELQRLQEESTGKKRTEKLDWMYATPSNEGVGALGGQRVGEKDLELYLLGKKRVDEVLKAGEQNIGAASSSFQAVQNANTPLDLAAKIREDPLLAIKKQEQLALQSLMSDPKMRRKMKEMKAEKEGRVEREGESKEERKERRRREKDDRKLAKKEAKRSSGTHHSRPYPSHSDRSEDSHSDRDNRRREDPRARDRDRDGYDRRERSVRRYPDENGRDRMRSRSRSPEGRSSQRRYEDRHNGYSNGSSNGRGTGHGRDREDYPPRNGSDRRDERPRDEYRQPSRPSNRPDSLDLAALPNYSRSRPSAPPPTSTINDSETRAARLAQMASDAQSHHTTRALELEARAAADKARYEEEEKARLRMGKQDTKGGYVREQERMAMGGMSLGDSLMRRGGKGLLREDD